MVARLTTSRRQPRKFFGVLWFASGADLRFGVRVVGVVEELAAGLAVRPVDAGVATAGVPIDAALGDEDVISLARGFFAFPAAGVLGHFFLGFALLALTSGEDLCGLLRLALMLLGGTLSFALGGFDGAGFRFKGHQGLIHRTDGTGGTDRRGGSRGRSPHLWWVNLRRAS